MSQDGDGPLDADIELIPGAEEEGASSSGAPRASLPSEKPIDALPLPPAGIPEALPAALRKVHAKLSDPTELLKLHLKTLPYVAKEFQVSDLCFKTTSEDL